MELVRVFLRSELPSLLVRRLLLFDDFESDRLRSRTDDDLTDELVEDDLVVVRGDTLVRELFEVGLIGFDGPPLRAVDVLFDRTGTLLCAMRCFCSRISFTPTSRSARIWACCSLVTCGSIGGADRIGMRVDAMKAACCCWRCI